MKVASLISRNLRILMRSKSTLVIILAAPLLALMLAAMSFDNNNQYFLKVAVFGESYPAIANQFLDELKQGSFQVDRLKSADDCRSAVRDGRYHACMLLESDGRKQVSIVLLVDFAKVQVVDHLLNRVSDKVSLKSSQISLNLTESLVRRIESTREEVEKNRYVITSLTTGQETIGRQLDELGARLAGLDPKVDIAGPSGLVSAIEKGEAVSQFASVSRLKDDLVLRLGVISREMEEVLKDSAISEDDKNKLRLVLSQNDDKVRRIGDEFRVTADLTKKDLDGLKTQLESVVATLSSLQDQLDGLRDVKMDANVQIRKLKGSLDDNLIKIVVLQTALNRIGSKVEGLKVNENGVQNPITTTVEPIASAPSRLNVIFPTILVFLVMVSCTLLAASLVSSHRQNPGAVRDALMPIHPMTRLMGLLGTVMVLVVAQTAVVFALAAGMLGSTVISGIPGASLVVFGVIVVFGLLGMVLGFAFSSEQGAVVAGVALTTAAFVFSDTLLPIESMPPYLGNLAAANPFVLGSAMVRRALIYNAPVATLFPGLVVLAVYGLALITILILQHRDRF